MPYRNYSSKTIYFQKSRLSKPSLRDEDLSSKKSSYIFHVKLFMTLLCCVGLIYHTVYLLKQYLSGRTIVNIRVGRLQFEPIPAVTICYPAFASWQKMSKINEKARLHYQDYLEKQANESFKHDEFIGMYDRSAQQFPKQSRSIMDIFDDLSIPLYNDKNELTIKIETGGLYRDSEGNIKYEKAFDTNPIETLTQEYGSKYMRKCFTFHSYLRKEWRNRTLDLDYIILHIKRDKRWFPLHTNDFIFNSVLIAMHSPNTIPDLINGQNFQTLRAGATHIVTYSSINTELLPPNYDTNCVDYDSEDTKPFGSQLRSDCISHCIIRSLMTRCGIDCVFQTETLLRRDRFLHNWTLRFCFNNSQDCIDEHYLRYKFNCLAKCSNACWMKYFTFDATQQQVHEDHLGTETTKVTIRHNGIPDQVISYIPETTFISFISSFGGLLGMWLGMSIQNSINFIVNNWHFLLSRLKRDK